MSADLKEPVALGSSPRNQWQVNAEQCSLVRTLRVAKPISLPALPQND